MSEDFSVESLKKSQKRIGQLYPVLTSPTGEVIDGLHRLEADPDWEKKVVETKSRMEDILVRVHAHHRRRVPQEETRMLLIELAQELEKSGIEKENIASELVKITPYSQPWVLRLLPEEYKQVQKVEAGKVGALLIEHKSQDLRKPLEQGVECECCGLGTYFPEQYEGKTVCQSCYVNLKSGNKTLPKQKPSPMPKKMNAIPKIKDSWEHRKATMQTPHSRMEQALMTKLHEKGLHPIVDHEFCLQSTTPDFFFVDKNVAIYLDGSVHEGKEQRDENLRELLTKRHGITVVSIPYETFTKQETERVLTEILEGIEN